MHSKTFPLSCADSQAILFNFVSVSILSSDGVDTFPIQGRILPRILPDLGIGNMIHLTPRDHFCFLAFILVSKYSFWRIFGVSHVHSNLCNCMPHSLTPRAREGLRNWAKITATLLLKKMLSRRHEKSFERDGIRYTKICSTA